MICLCFCVQKLLDRAQERDHCLSETKVGEGPPPQVVELRHTIQVLQQRLEEKEGRCACVLLSFKLSFFFL